MKKILLALSAFVALSGSVFAADLPRKYTKAPEPVATSSWTGFYIFGGAGGGIWDAENNGLFLGACDECTHPKVGGDGYFGTVGAGYDYQMGSWVGGVFADGSFGTIKGTLLDSGGVMAASEKLKTSYAAGVRAGYLVGPNVLSYVNVGYSGSQWGRGEFFTLQTGNPQQLHTDGFSRDGWFIGGGVENNLDIFGVHLPGLFMKTEYRAAYYGTKTLDQLADYNNSPTEFGYTFKPYVQTITTSLVYRFNATGPMVAADPAPMMYTKAYAKAPAKPAASSWTGFYISGGAGGGVWDTDTQVFRDGVCFVCTNVKVGGDGYFGTVGAGYDYQMGSWVGGVFADGSFGAINGTIADPDDVNAASEHLKTSYAAGVRGGYLIAPNVLSYVNAGYSGSQWKGAEFFRQSDGSPAGFHIDGFSSNGWFVGGGVENNLDIFGIHIPGLFMKTEYRAAYYGTKTIDLLRDTSNTLFEQITFKPYVQTVSTSLVYRFNAGPVAAKY